MGSRAVVLGVSIGPLTIANFDPSIATASVFRRTTIALGNRPELSSPPAADRLLRMDVLPVDGTPVWAFASVTHTGRSMSRP